MDNVILIKRVRVTGKKTCDYRLNPRLNIFTGSNSTGKSTIMHIIDHIFGRKGTETFIQEVEDNCDQVYLDLEINSKNYTIRRGIRIGRDEIDVFNEHFNDLNSIKSAKFIGYSPMGRKGRPAISEFYFNELGIHRGKVKATKEKGNLVTLSWRNLTNLIYVPQGQFGNLQTKSDHFQPLMKAAVFETIFGISGAEVEQLETTRSELEKDQLDLERKYEVLHGVVEEQIKNAKAEKSISEIETELTRLDLEKLDLFESLKIKNETNELLDEQKNLEASFTDVKLKIIELKDRFEQLEMLKNENELNLEKNRMLLDARRIFSELPITKCPKCFNNIDKQDISSICDICGKEFKEFNSQKEYTRSLFLLMDEKKELTSIIDTVSKDLVNLNENEKQIQDRKLSLDKKIDEINKEIVSPVLRKVEIINVQINDLREKLGKSKQINSLVQNESYLKQQISNNKIQIEQITSEITKVKEASEFAKKVKEKFEKLLEEILKDTLNYPAQVNGLNQYYLPNLEEQMFDPNLGEGLKRSQILRVVLGYYTTILEYSLKYGSPHPKLLILDTPREEELDMVIFEKVLSRWINLKNYNKKYQIIITGNEFPPENKEISNCIITTLHNQKESGDTSKVDKFSIM